MNVLKEFIYKECFTKTNRLNNRIVFESWWINKGFVKQYDEIVEKNPFVKNMSEKIYWILNDLIEIPKCPVCGKPCSFQNYKSGYYQYCSRYCVTQSEERNKKISIKNDYVSIKNKMKETCQSRYGVSWTTQTDFMKEKTKETKMKKYGNEYYNNPTKSQETCLSRYGVQWAGQAEITKSNILKTISKKRPILFDKTLLENENTKKSISQIAQDLSVTYRTVWLAFDRVGLNRKFYTPNYSKLEKHIQEFLQSENVCFLANDRQIFKPKELDIYIPNHNLAIELNGVYWHSFSEKHTKQDKEKHKTKYNLCLSKDIHLLQFWDLEWITKQDICKDIISRSLIYARNCIINKITYQETTDFLDKNHMQGSIKSLYRYGLFYKGELVSVMVFGKSRFKNTGFELLRFCTKHGLIIIGGPEKLFRGFIKDVNPSKVISYCDLRLFKGTLYERLGFIKAGRPVLDYYWTKNNVILTRHSTQKHKLKNLLATFNPALTEDENMFLNDYRKLYGVGIQKWVYNH